VETPTSLSAITTFQSRPASVFRPLTTAVLALWAAISFRSQWRPWTTTRFDRCICCATGTWCRCDSGCKQRRDPGRGDRRLQRGRWDQYRRGDHLHPLIHTLQLPGPPGSPFSRSFPINGKTAGGNKARRPFRHTTRGPACAQRGEGQSVFGGMIGRSITFGSDQRMQKARYAIAALSLAALASFGGGAMADGPTALGDTGVAPKTTIGTFGALSGSDLKSTLEGWAKSAGWTLIWDSPVNYRLRASARFSGDFRGGGFGSGGYDPQVEPRASGDFVPRKPGHLR
jgi:hypothetical protein